MCGLGHHAFETIGTRVDSKHRFSDVHETLYEVRFHRAMLRCAACGAESVTTDHVEESVIGRYEHTFVSVRE